MNNILSIKVRDTPDARAGIVGLVALSLGAKAVLMTDIAAVLPSLNENVEANVRTCLQAAGVDCVPGAHAFHCLSRASASSCGSPPTVTSAAADGSPASESM